MAVNDGYEPVIGLEVHAQLQTNSKIFCGCGSSYGEPPNTLTCPVCLGLPGALPVLNKTAVEFAIRMILAVGGTVRRESVFARKNYFYPDLPKGYQISQYDMPVGEGGEVRFRIEKDTVETCRLARIHLEEDAGKLIHPEHGESDTLVDLNRCGAPLIEIVTRADLRSPDAAYSLLTTLKQILQYLKICSGDMEKGHLRCDANVSVRPEGRDELGTRTELKNMNSFKAVQRAIRFEVDRQTDLIGAGKKVEQVTLLWNENEQKAEVMRSKEESQDYRYFPEPDLFPLDIPDEWIEEVRENLPEMPQARDDRFRRQYGIREYDAAVLTASRSLADYFEEVVNHLDDAQAAANWIGTELLGRLKEEKRDIDSCPVKPKQIADLLAQVKSGCISGKIAKEVFSHMIATGEDSSIIIKEKGLAQITDETTLLPVIEDILRNNADNVSQYRSGKSAVFGFFVGQVMKATGGQASPAVVNRLLKRKLDR